MNLLVQLHALATAHGDGALRPELRALLTNDAPALHPVNTLRERPVPAEEARP